MPFPLAEALEDATNPAPGIDAPDDNPEETEGGKRKAVTYGPDNRDLPEELQNAGMALLLEAQKQDLYQRRVEVLRARRDRFYERGIQHIYENVDGFFVIGTAGATVPNPANPNEDLQCGQYINNYNVFGRALRIIVAKLTENPIGVDFEPDSGDESKDLQASTAAESYRVNFDRRNDPKDVLTAIVRNMGNDGRTVTWTRTEADVQRWGTDAQGEPRRVQTVDIFGVLETKVPIMAKTLGDCPYFVITDDPHVFSAKMQYPYFSEEITTYGESGIADDEFERIARIGVLQGASASYQITDTYQYYCERKRVWFRPAMFESKELEGSYQGGTLKDAFKAAFPDGAMFTFVGEQYVGSRNACMDDELAVDFPYPGEGMSREGYMDPAVPLQDDFNDDLNNYHEVRVVGWPSTWVRASTAELASINDQIAAPYCFRALPSKPSSEMEMEDHFYREPDPGIPASFMEATEWMVTYLLQFILAIPSAVQGAGMKDQKLMDVLEPIPTPYGWIPNGDLHDGDSIFGEDGKVHRIVKAHPIQEEMGYRVTFDDGSAVTVHAGHLWATWTRDERRGRWGGKPKVRTTQEISDSLFVGKDTTQMGICANHAIRICQPIELPEVDLPIDPYCLGAWLGDGSSSGGSHYTASPSDGPEILKHFDAAGYPTKRLKSPNAWSIGGGFTRALYSLGVRRNKHVPVQYIWASKSQRLALLQGLMDTDGNCSPRGRARFTNTNHGIASAVYWLASSLGLKPFWREEQPRLKGAKHCAIAYWVEWSGSLPVFRLKRKLARTTRVSGRQQWRYITSVTPVGMTKMRCLTTDNPTGLYLFGRNFNVTHNTASGYQAALVQAMGQLGLIWGAVQRLMARVYMQAALAASREPQDGKPLVIPNKKGQPIVVQMADLGKGHFLCHPSTDAGYPEGTMAKRGTLSQILQLIGKNPEALQALLASPDNWDFIFASYGVPELVIPEARVRRKQMAETELLLKSQPVPPSPEELQAAQVAHAEQVMTAKATGQPAPPPFDPASLLHSSIPPDPLDYHPWEFEECREELSDWPKIQEQLAMKPCPLCQGQGADETGRPCPDCNGQGETNNAAGIQNLRLHAAEHQKFIQQAQQAAQQAQAAMIAATHPKATESWKPALPGAAPA